MKVKDIVAKCDHTMLDPCATLEDIIRVCDEGVKYGAASVCIPACYVRDAWEYMEDKYPETKIPVCTVIGFPNGYDTSESKCFMTKNAIVNGASEIDMVVNLGWVKDRQYPKIIREIKAIKEDCGDKILKVIIETCRLTDDEKYSLCQAVTAAGADYIKTSTGFSTGGATISDVDFLRKCIGENVQVKASGGIKSLSQARDMIEHGADRLGTSKIIAIIKENGFPLDGEV